MNACRTRLLTCVVLSGCFAPTGSTDPSATVGSSSSASSSSSSSSSGDGVTSATSGASTEVTLSSSTSTTDAGTTSGTTGGICGDGQLDEGEECDDAGAQDGCSDSCTKEFRRVFITSKVFTGELGGLAGADQKCQDAADDGGLPGVYKAWLSSSDKSPLDRFVPSTVPYRQVNGDEIASDWDDLVDGNLKAGIVVSELNGPPGKGVHGCMPVEVPVWTNTQDIGAATFPDKHCNDWASSSGTAMVGRAGDTTFQWTQSCEASCGDDAALYCFEQ